MMAHIQHRVRVALVLAALASILLALPASASCPVIHVVQPGENLYRISLRYGVGLYALAAANGITDINYVRVGQQLVIPGGCPAVVPCPPPPAPSPYPPMYYTVRYGDTLASIARRFGTTVGCLMQVNAIPNPNTLYAGRVLWIPAAPCWSPPPPHPFYPPPPPAPCPVPQPQPPAPGHWQAEFYDNGALLGAPIFRRMDSDINFNWGSGSPAQGVPPDDFSVRWTRTLYMSNGTYRLTARADDGVRVYVGGILVIDAWQVQPLTTYTQNVVLLSSGNRTLTVEYFEAQGLAEVQVTVQRM